MFEECVLGWGRLVGWPVHTDFLTGTVEDERELKVIKFLNTVIAATPAPQGHQDKARADPSKPHKGVAFDASITKFGEAERTNLKPPKDNTPIYQTPAELPKELTPSVIEQLILCSCANHKHCLTCQFSRSEWSTFIKNLTMPNQNPNDKPTRWIAPLYSLDRALKIWLGEQVNSLGGWGVSLKGTHANSAIQDHLHLSQAISEMVDDSSRRLLSSLSKAQKALNDTRDYAEKISHLESLANSDEKKVGLETNKRRYTRAKNNACERMIKMVYILEGREKKLYKQLKDGSDFRDIKHIRECISRDADAEKAWPAGSRRKLKLIHAVLILILKDVTSFYGKIKELAEPWNINKTELKERERNGMTEQLDATAVKDHLEGLIRPTMREIETWYGPALKGHREVGGSRQLAPSVEVGVIEDPAVSMISE
ncbi:hypothetical protein QBC37DRAFT_458338 [Rhypophila decipiens]|uniref:Uncharacterized protein n=1 Tax=Rhypophila decipiens TaxID=261697 RepID=A0AAN6XTG1_9PEZI|nr:hypothetical protein QBC37DRAFT_458338 [Rhypophila decipiens]